MQHRCYSMKESTAWNMDLFSIVLWVTPHHRLNHEVSHDSKVHIMARSWWTDVDNAQLISMLAFCSTLFAFKLCCAQTQLQTKFSTHIRCASCYLHYVGNLHPYFVGLVPELPALLRTTQFIVIFSTSPSSMTVDVQFDCERRALRTATISALVFLISASPVQSIASLVILRWFIYSISLLRWQGE